MTAVSAANSTQVSPQQKAIQHLQEHVQRQIVGQEKLVNRLLITCLLYTSDAADDLQPV